MFGAGVYALYYTGAHPLYQAIRGTEKPIYVGQARPEGTRKGNADPKVSPCCSFSTRTSRIRTPRRGWLKGRHRWRRSGVTPASSGEVTRERSSAAMFFGLHDGAARPPAGPALRLAG
ncbi:Eco29kI family restriction endonuclease [Kitasatospora sp. NPDC004289]